MLNLNRLNTRLHPLKLAIAVSALTLSTQGQTASSAQVQEPSAVLEQKPSAVGAHAAPAPTTPQELTFEQAIQAALDFDTQYKVALQKFEADKEESTQALSRLLPQVNFSASLAYEDTDNIYTDQSSGYFDPNQPRSEGQLTDRLWRLSVDQTLFDWGAYKELKASENSVQAARYRLQKAEQELVYRTTERYLNVLYKAQLVYLNTTIHDALNLRLQQTQRKSDLGVGDQLELYEVQARKDLARTDLLQSQSELEDEQTRLRIITGVHFVPPEAWVKHAYNIELSSELQRSEQEWLDLAQQNFDYLESEANARVADLQRAARSAGHLPTLALGVSYSYRESDDPFRDREGVMASLEMRLPIYQGGKTSSAVRQSLARFRAQEATSESIMADTRQKVSLSYAQIRNTAKRLDALKQSLLSSQRYLDAAERGQSLNLRSQLDVLDARTQMLDVQLRLAEALNQYLLADLNLRFQVGRLGNDHVRFYDELFIQAAEKE